MQILGIGSGILNTAARTLHAELSRPSYASYHGRTTHAHNMYSPAYGPGPAAALNYASGSNDPMPMIYVNPYDTAQYGMDGMGQQQQQAFTPASAGMDRGYAYGAAPGYFDSPTPGAY